jgi:signal recognition particle GTPase
MNNKFEQYVENTLSHLNEHQADEEQDNKLKKTLRSILLNKGVDENNVTDMVIALFNAFQKHLSETQGE